MKDLTPVKSFEELTVDSVVGKAYAKGFYYYKVHSIQTYGTVTVAWGKRVLKGTHEQTKKYHGHSLLGIKNGDSDSVARHYQLATEYNDKFDLIKVHSHKGE